METLKILFADDHELVRDTISAFLERESDFELTLAEDFDSAARLIEDSDGFDLVLLDYTMPGMNGLEGLSRALTLNQGKPVAIMSGTADRTIAQAALGTGSAGFLPKTMAAKSLIHAIRFMVAGEKYAPLDFMTTSSEKEEHRLASKLSARELDVLGGLCRGLSNKEIARDLDLQEVTIKLHVKTLSRKLDARNRTHAAMIAKDEGLF